MEGFSFCNITTMSSLYLAVAAVLAFSGCAPLYRAAGRGDEAAVRRLLAGGAKVEGSPALQNLGAVPRPIRGAAEKGHTGIVRLLLDSGAKIEGSAYYESALYAALLYQHEDTARLLLERGANARIARAGLEKHAAGRTIHAARYKAAVQLLDELEKGRSPARPAAAVAPGLPPLKSPRFSAAERPDDIAVVVGIEAYSEFATKAPYAERDADAVKAHLLALGVPERNIVLLKGAKAGKASIEKHLSTWLPQLAKTGSRVYFYFSGHGAPDIKTGKAYLVPWDGDPNFLADTAVPLDRLYAKLAALPSERVLVAIDSCFSGAGGRSVLASGARPLVTRVETGDAPAKLTVLSASAADEVSGSLDDKGHGAFTYFLLEGLNAGKTTPKALVDYLTPQVQDESRRLNRSQTPQLRGDGDWPLR